MSDLGKITITKNKDCDNKTYYSAYIYGMDAVIGGGNTRNEAKDELFGNIVFYVNYLTETNQKLKQQLVEKEKKLLEFKRDKLYFELLITRLQWLHKRADEYKEEKERFGIDEEISLSSVWDVLSLQKNNICEYEEMYELQEGIECIANSRLLKDIEHDLQIKVTRKENEIFKDIELIDNQIKELKGE